MKFKLLEYDCQRMVVAFDDLHCRKALDTKKRMISKKQKPVAALGDPSNSRQELQVGLRLRHQRMSLRMTLRDLADQAGCSESMLSKVENGRALPSLTTLHRICRVLGLTVSRLLSKSGEPPGVVARAGERPVTNVQAVRPNSGIKVEQLIPVDPANRPRQSAGRQYPADRARLRRRSAHHASRRRGRLRARGHAGSHRRTRDLHGQRRRLRLLSI
jgi:transcriptional regulator with XRE-family HTH domain